MNESSRTHLGLAYSTLVGALNDQLRNMPDPDAVC